jgi:hypothetical protein
MTSAIRCHTVRPKFAKNSNVEETTLDLAGPVPDIKTKCGADSIKIRRIGVTLPVKEKGWMDTKFCRGVELWVRDLKTVGLNSAAPVRDESSCLPLVNKRVQWGQIKPILDSCYRSHALETAHASGRGGSLPMELRLIDVVQRRVVPFGPGAPPFVALSYVWGERQLGQLRATRATMSKLQQNGGLVASRMPSTIEDAMEACRQLDERYLWVDILCIEQDNEKDFNSQVYAMDVIYSRARLVLVAADGSHMNAGLCGVSRSRPDYQHRVVIEDLELSHSLPDLIPDCFWNSRGWTYQEAILSARKLYFTPNSLVYECEQHPHNEACPWDNRRENPHYLKYHDESTFMAFDRHATIFNTRQLAIESDIYNAFAGISNALYGGDAASHLPRRIFDRALLWAYRYWFYELRDGSPKGGEPFAPSWSWCSIKPTRSITELDDTLWRGSTRMFVGSLVCWDEQNGSRIQAIERDGGHRRYDPLYEEQWRVYMAVAWVKGCIAVQPPSTLESSGMDWTRDVFAQLDERLHNRWPEYSDYWHDAFYATQNAARGPVDLLPGVLSARIQLARLFVGYSRHNLLPTSHYFIADDTGTLIGYLLQGAGDSQQLDKALRQQDGPSKFDFVGLSVGGDYDGTIQRLDGCPSVHPDKPLFLPDEADRTVHDSTGKPLTPLPVVNVMMVERQKGMARRLALGQVLLTKWAAIQRETVVLRLR